MEYHIINDLDEINESSDINELVINVEAEPELVSESEPVLEPVLEPVSEPEPIVHTISLPLNLLQGFMNIPMNHLEPPSGLRRRIISSPMPTTFEERFMNQSFHQQPKFKHVASKDFINSLSVQKVSPELVEKKTTCALCLDELSLGEDIIELPCKDKHYFHIKKEDCPGIYPWLKDNNTCPMCRHQFPFEEKEIEQESGNLENPIRLPRLQAPNPNELRQIVYQAIEDEEERMLQEALYASLNQ